jgi:hypothetical protein
MTSATAPGGMTSEFTVEQRNAQGKLIYREASVMMPKLPPAPPEPKCFSDDCIDEYEFKIEIWANQCKAITNKIKLLNEYHHLRAEYCMKKRHENIEEKYRTGDPSPVSEDEIKEAIKILRKLKEN